MRKLRQKNESTIPNAVRSIMVATLKPKHSNYGNKQKKKQKWQQKKA